jgi:hypothetical protein
LSIPKLDPDHMKGLVNSRAAIQETLLHLYLFVRRIGESPDSISAKTEAVASLLAGAAFSLWRAVFYSDSAGEPAQSLSRLEEFLASVVNDNAITYQDEKRYRDWTYVYYYSNARLRIWATRSFLSEEQFTDEVRESMDLTALDGPRSREQIRIEWEHAHYALRHVFHTINPEFPKLVRPEPAR